MRFLKGDIMKVHKIEAVYLNNYYTAYKPTQRQEKRTMLQRRKALEALEGDEVVSKVDLVA
jgi:hypothetical protein